MSNELREKRRKELRGLTKRGLLRAEDVVEFARDPRTALHSIFEWDDSIAAHEYRIWQARQFLRVEVLTEPNLPSMPLYVSLVGDRQREGGGYREMVQVLSNADMRKELLSQAFRELEEMKRRYASLQELAAVFASAEKAKKRHVG